MGYVITTLPVRYAKKAILDAGIPLHVSLELDGTGSYFTIYKANMDLTNCNKIAFAAHNASAQDAYIRLKVGAATVDTHTISNGTRDFWTVDISGYTGANDLEILYNHTAAQVLENLSFWGMI